MVRRLEAEAEAQPGARIVGRCAPEVAAAAARLLPLLAQRLGSRFTLEPDPVCPRERLEAVAR
jgi:hypothetical protein